MPIGNKIRGIYLSGIFSTPFITCPKYGSVSGLKVDEDGKVIKGAVFGLFSNDENEYTRENAYMVTESAEDGTFKFEKIPYGTWVVREIEPAVGFVLNEKAYQITPAER